MTPAMHLVGKRPQTEAEEVQERAQQATVLLMQPFWAQLSSYMSDLRAAALQRLRECRNADPVVQQRALDRWHVIEEVTKQIERYPVIAIDAAKEK